jgi:capsular polysaccharide transport system permease protein
MATSNGRFPDDDRIRILDFAAVLLRRCRLVLAVAVVTVLLAGVGYALTPKLYVSRTTLVSPPSDGGGARGLSAQLPAAMAARLGASSGSHDKLVTAILKSQLLRDTLAHRVASEPDVPAGATEAQIHRILGKHTRVRQNTAENSVAIEVAAHDPHLAARIAAEFPTLVSEIATSITVANARQKQQVVERQLHDARERLAAAEEQLLAFSRERGTTDLPEQTRQTFAAVSQIEQVIVAKEVEVAELQRRVTPENPQLRQALSELGALRQQRRRIMGGASSDDGLLAQRDLPELRAQVARLMREQATNEQVYLSLTAAYASTQVDVNENLALLTVLDPPTVPESPTGAPVRWLVISLLLGVVLGVVAAFVREYAARVRTDPESEPFNSALDGFRSDVAAWIPLRTRKHAPPSRHG